jgi:predicted double-glycine peptidase
MLCAFGIALAAAVATPVSVSGGASPTPVVSQWTVAGTSNRLGSYTGQATLTLKGDKASLDVTATFDASSPAQGETFSWTGTGTLTPGDVDLTIDLRTGDPDLVGVTSGGASQVTARGEASYVIAQDGQSFQGYWSVDRVTIASKRKTVHGAGGTETFTLSSGAALVAVDPTLASPALPTDALPVPIMTQPDDYSCGPCSLEACFYYYKVDDGAGVKYLYPLVHTTAKNGTEPGPLAAYATELGLSASFQTGATLADLRASLAQRDPVIIDLQAWTDKVGVDWKTDVADGHYVVLVGMDAQYAYFMDPSGHFGYAFLPLTEFEDRWHDTDKSGNRFDHGAIFLHGQAPVGRAMPLVRMQ